MATQIKSGKLIAAEYSFLVDAGEFKKTITVFWHWNDASNNWAITVKQVGRIVYRSSSIDHIPTILESERIMIAADEFIKSKKSKS